MEGEYGYDGGATSSPRKAGRRRSIGAEAGGDRAAGGRERPAVQRRRGGQHADGLVDVAEVGPEAHQGLTLYPRAYYRCSSSKGCPAKKQMERSRADLAMVVVSYSSEHNHAAKVPRASQSRQVQKPKPQPVTPEPAEPEGVYGKDAAVGVHDEFRWFYNGVSTSPSEEEGTDEMLYGPMFLDAGAVGTAPVLIPDECAGDEGGFGGEGGEEDGLFAGLGELPECAIVFRHRGCLAGGVKVEQPPERTATS